MGSRDHSITCEDCGYDRGGLNDLECLCDDRVRLQSILSYDDAHGIESDATVTLSKANGKCLRLLIVEFFNGTREIEHAGCDVQQLTPREARVLAARLLCAADALESAR